MRLAFEKTVRAAGDLNRGGIDAALIQSGRMLSTYLDEEFTAGGQNAQKAAYLVPHLLNLLREMGATPAARAAAGKAAADADSKEKAPAGGNAALYDLQNRARQRRRGVTPAG